VVLSVKLRSAHTGLVRMMSKANPSLKNVVVLLDLAASQASKQTQSMSTKRTALMEIWVVNVDTPTSAVEFQSLKSVLFVNGKIDGGNMIDGDNRHLRVTTVSL
jgi:hypothetical protein